LLFRKTVLAKNTANFHIAVTGSEHEMATSVKKTTVRGGYIARSVKTGRFVEVGTSAGAKKASSKTLATVKSASEKRKAALKRLADR
jgi:hypothetical protein